MKKVRDNKKDRMPAESDSKSLAQRYKELLRRREIVRKAEKKSSKRPR